MVHDATQLGCWVFLRPPSRLGYRALPMIDGDDGGVGGGSVTVVVGKEKRVFTVDPFVLEKNPFRVLLEKTGADDRGRRRKKRNRESDSENSVLFVDVDAILFEHLLWLVYNEQSNASLLDSEMNLKEIIDFYSQDY